MNSRSKNPLLFNDESPTLNADEDVVIDVERLIVTRALVQGSSGSGKSTLLRRLIEQTYGRAQQFVFDPDGEFHTLREKLDLVLVGPGGDCPALVNPGDEKDATDARHTYAGMLALKLLTMGVSAILDVSELGTKRGVFVRRFIEGMMAAPRELWHPVEVVIDECQKFAPERGASDADSTEAIKDLATRGRKRGFCLIAATQRIAELHKTVIAECGNKLIGRTTMDLDIDRARRILGMSAKSADEDLPYLPDGHFYVTGSAFGITGKMQLVKTGPVFTTHPKAGSGALPPTPPRKQISAILAELQTLPVDVEQKAKTVDDLQKKIGMLENELSSWRLGSDPIDMARLKLELDNALKAKFELQKKLTDSERLHEVTGDAQEKITATIDRVITELTDARNEYVNALDDEIAEAAAGGPIANVDDGQRGSGQSAPHVTQQGAGTPGQRESVAAGNVADLRRTPADHRRADPSSTLSKMERAFLTVLAQRGEMPTVGKLLLFADYQPSGPVSTALANLRRQGFVAGVSPHGLIITPAGLVALGTYEPLPTGKALREQISSGLPGPMHRAFFGKLCDIYPQTIARGALLNATGYASSGPASSALGYLTKRDYAKALGKSLMTANPELFK